MIKKVNIARELWGRVAGPYSGATACIKNDLFPLSQH